MRRCRPLLGTLVEIAAIPSVGQCADDGVEAAFAAVTRVHRLMSFHDDASDVARLNRCAADGEVEVDPWTYEVLRAARRFHECSRGAFDVSVAPHLQRWGYLPGAADAVAGAAVDQSAIDLRPQHRVRFRRKLRIDLGGIAKGFAVDRAIDALQAAGTAAGMVNAGGDLRGFGIASTIHVRHPGMPGRTLPLLRIRSGAVATSASYFAKKRWSGRWVWPLVDPSRGRACETSKSVSVHAPTCVVADALTKVVLLLGRRSIPILREHGATGYVVSRSGRVHRMEDAA